MRRNITEVSKFHMWIIPLWFLLSIFLGYTITIPHFLLGHIKSIFMPYMIYMNRYDIFCNTMFFIIFLFPIVLFSLMKNGYTKIYHGLRARLFILICAIISISGLIPIELMEDSKDNRIYYIARDIMFYLDWFGGVLLNFFFLYSSILCITVAFSKNKGF